MGQAHARERSRSKEKKAARITVAEGPRMVRVSKKGFKPFERTIQAQPNGEQRIAVELEPVDPKPQLDGVNYGLYARTHQRGKRKAGTQLEPPS
jgi:hypothetical protein